MRLKFTLAIFLFTATNVYCSSYYIKTSLGYGIPLGGLELTRSTGDGTSYDKYIRGRLSAGKGLLFSIGGGNMVNKHVGWEVVAAGAVLSNSRTTNQVPNSSYEKLEHYRNFNITPTLRIEVPLPLSQTGIWSHTALFGRFGMVVPFINSGYIEYSEVLNGNFYYKKEKIVNFFDPGFVASIGLSVELSEKILLFSEISGQNLNNKIKSSEVVQYTVNGVDELYTLTTAEREIHYHRKRVTDSDNLPISSTFDPNKPADRLTTITPAHNVGINFGIIFKI